MERLTNFRRKVLLISRSTLNAYPQPNPSVAQYSVYMPGANR